MKPAPFAFERPTDLPSVIDRLANGSGTVMAIAGAQSLLPMMALRVARPDLIVDVGALSELRAVTETPAAVMLGAGVTHAQIEDGAVPDPSAGLMPRVASRIAYRAVRNHGTLGGSLALSDPAADWPACMLALDATLIIQGPQGTRRIPIDNFLVGAYATALAAGELILAVEIPKQPRLRWGAAKVVRKSGAFASSMAIVAVADTARVVLGATTTRPRLLPRTAEKLAAKATDLDSAIAADIQSADPDADAYLVRAHTATVRRAIKEALAR